MSILEIRNLHAEAGDKKILKGIDLVVQPGEVHAIMGPNGSGKSTLAGALAGRPSIEVTQGEVLLDGKDLLSLAPEIRAREGRLDEISWRLGDPDIHRNPNAIREVETERDEIRSRVDELYREWERLAAEVEAGEQGVG